MALVKGANCGFVTEAPTSDPGGTSADIFDSQALANRYTTPAQNITITEIGWWCSHATESSDFEVGIYSHDSINDEPESLLFNSNAVSKGTTSGWKRIIGLNWELDASTIYWIAIQLDNTTTSTGCDYDGMAGEKQLFDNSQTTTLAETWVTSLLYDNYLNAIYAVWEATPVGTEGKADITTLQVYNDTEGMMYEYAPGGPFGDWVPWDPEGTEGDSMRVYVEVTNNGADDNLKTELIGDVVSSDEFFLGAGLTYVSNFNFTMPNQDVNITVNASHLE